MSVRVNVSLGTFVAATQLSKRFNLVADRVAGRERVAEVIEQAAEFMEAVAEKMFDGYDLAYANPFEWDMPYMTHAQARQIGETKVFPPTDDVLKQIDAQFYEVSEKRTTFADVTNETAARLTTVSQFFNLASQTEAIRLSIALYADAIERLWRDNGIYLLKDNDRQDFDTQKFKARIKTSIR